MTELKIRLTTSEMRVLKEKAHRELRQPDAQARYILRQVLFGQNKTADSNCEVYEAEQLRSGFAEVVNS